MATNVLLPLSPSGAGESPVTGRQMTGKYFRSASRPKKGSSKGSSSLTRKGPLSLNGQGQASRDFREKEKVESVLDFNPQRYFHYIVSIAVSVLSPQLS